MNTNYITNDEVYKIERFFTMPSEMIYGKYKKLSSEAKLLYMLLLDRTKLSARNHFVDTDGRVFIFFKREEAAKTLNVTIRTMSKVFRELSVIDLIDEIPQGNQKAYKIFVKLPEKASIDQNKTNQQKKKRKTMLQKRQQTLKNLNSSIKIKKEVLQNIERTIREKKAANLKAEILRLRPEIIQETKEQIEYDYFKDNLDVFSMSLEFLDSFVYAVAEMKTSLQTKIGSVYYDHPDVMNILEELDSCTFMDFCTHFKKISNKEEFYIKNGQYKRRSKLAGIHNLKAYLKSCLINYLEDCNILYSSIKIAAT